MTTHTPHEVASAADDVTEALILDGSKIQWHMDRVEAWERGERIAPITIDMALTRACNYACGFCYAMLQENDRSNISKDNMTAFLEDSAEMGVRAISLVSDGRPFRVVWVISQFKGNSFAKKSLVRCSDSKTGPPPTAYF